MTKLTPATLPEALAITRQVFTAVGVPYWIAGGWAIDLRLGRQRRQHGDVDVLVRAIDADVVARTLPSPPLVQFPGTGATRPWVPGEVLTPGPDVLLLSDTTPCPIQILLAASDREDWVYHRGSGRVHRPWLDITGTSAGLPHLTPEIVLLFKAQELRDRDFADFAAVQESLTVEQRRWLIDRIRPRFPDHPWLAELSAPAPVDAPPLAGRS